MTTLTQQYTLGEPQVAGPLAVFPIFGPEPQLEYRVLSEALELGAFVKELGFDPVRRAVCLGCAHR